MQSVKIGYREPALVLTVCPYGACISDSSICGSYEGINESGKAVLCSLDSTDPEA